jgi:hypothetical protein
MHVGVRGAVLRRTCGFGGLTLALALALLLWWLQPIVSGRSYLLGVQTTATLLVVWLVWTARPSVTSNRAVLWLLVAAGSAWSAARALTLGTDGEVIHTYRSLFAALGQDRDPYTCQCIVHQTSQGVRLGDFNYPPGEIWPYELVRSLVGYWDSTVLALSVMCFNAVAFALIFVASPRHRRPLVLAFLPFLVLWELRTTIATTMVVTAAIVAVLLLAAGGERTWHRPALWLAFGVGLLTKFAVIPLFAVWWWSTTASRARAASAAPRMRLLPAATADVLVPVGIALLLCLPFGVVSVARETLLFNMDLGRRDELTDFYPNVVSGLLTWGRLGWLYPVLAGTIMVVAILLAPRLQILTAMLLATTVFLLASPTAEPQYLPVAMLLLLGALAERELRGPGAVRGDARRREFPALRGLLGPGAWRPGSAGHSPMPGPPGLPTLGQHGASRAPPNP